MNHAFTGAKKHCEQCERMISAEKQGFISLRKPLALQLNSLEDEYAPILMKDGEILFFTARRPETTGENINSDDSKYFEDMYRANWNPITMDYELDYEFFKSINTNGFDALNYLSPDKTWGILTLNTTETGEKKTTRGSDLCEIKMSAKSTWNSPKAIKNKTSFKIPV